MPNVMTKLILLLLLVVLFNGPVHCMPSLHSEVGDKVQAIDDWSCYSTVKTFISKFEFLKMTSLKSLYYSIKESYEDNALSNATRNIRWSDEATTSTSSFFQTVIDKFEFLKLTSLKSLYYSVKDFFIERNDSEDVTATPKESLLKFFEYGFGLVQGFKSLFYNIKSKYNKYNPFVVSIDVKPTVLMPILYGLVDVTNSKIYLQVTRTLTVNLCSAAPVTITSGSLEKLW